MPVAFQNQFRQVFAILKGLGSAQPSDHFTIDLKGKKIGNANQDGLRFNEFSTEFQLSFN